MAAAIPLLRLAQRNTERVLSTAPAANTRRQESDAQATARIVRPVRSRRGRRLGIRLFHRLIFAKPEQREVTRIEHVCGAKFFADALPILAVSLEHPRTGDNLSACLVAPLLSRHLRPHTR